jgi:hypothetical protein
MTLRPLAIAVLAALMAAALMALVAATPATPPAQAASFWCKKFTLPASHIKARIRVLRRVKCKRARTIARKYDRFLSTSPWNCALAHDGARYRGRLVLYSCGAGTPGSGDLRTWEHAFLVVKP